MIEYKRCSRLVIKELSGIEFCAVQADLGYLPDNIFREDEVEGLWGSF